MSETHEHKDTAGCGSRFKGSLFSENYRKDRAAYKEIVEAKFNDIIAVQELLNRYGDQKLSDLLKDVQGRYNMAKEMLDTFCKEEDEADTGMAASLAPMFTYLVEKGYHAGFHVDCIEIVPIEEWVKEEIASFPPKSAAFYGYILHDHLVRMGFPSEKVNEWMKG